MAQLKVTQTGKHNTTIFDHPQQHVKYQGVQVFTKEDIQKMTQKGPPQQDEGTFKNIVTYTFKVDEREDDDPKTQVQKKKQQESLKNVKNKPKAIKKKGNIKVEVDPDAKNNDQPDAKDDSGNNQAPDDANQGEDAPPNDDTKNQDDQTDQGDQDQGEGDGSGDNKQEQEQEQDPNQDQQGDGEDQQIEGDDQVQVNQKPEEDKLSVSTKSNTQDNKPKYKSAMASIMHDCLNEDPQEDDKQKNKNPQQQHQFYLDKVTQYKKQIKTLANQIQNNQQLELRPVPEEKEEKDNDIDKSLQNSKSLQENMTDQQQTQNQDQDQEQQQQEDEDKQEQQSIEKEEQQFQTSELNQNKQDQKEEEQENSQLNNDKQDDEQQSDQQQKPKMVESQFPQTQFQSQMIESQVVQNMKEQNTKIENNQQQDDDKLNEEKLLNIVHQYELIIRNLQTQLQFYQNQEKVQKGVDSLISSLVSEKPGSHTLSQVDSSISKLSHKLVETRQQIKKQQKSETKRLQEQKLQKFKDDETLNLDDVLDESDYLEIKQQQKVKPKINQEDSLNLQQILDPNDYVNISNVNSDISQLSLKSKKSISLKESQISLQEIDSQISDILQLSGFNLRESQISVSDLLKSDPSLYKQYKLNNNSNLGDSTIQLQNLKEFQLIDSNLSPKSMRKYLSQYSLNEINSDIGSLVSKESLNSILLEKSENEIINESNKKLETGNTLDVDIGSVISKNEQDQLRLDSEYNKLDSDFQGSQNYSQQESENIQFKLTSNIFNKSLEMSDVLSKSERDQMMNSRDFHDLDSNVISELSKSKSISSNIDSIIDPKEQKIFLKNMKHQPINKSQASSKSNNSQKSKLQTTKQPVQGQIQKQNSQLGKINDPKLQKTTDKKEIFKKREEVARQEWDIDSSINSLISQSEQKQLLEKSNAKNDKKHLINNYLSMKLNVKQQLENGLSSISNISDI